MTKDDIDIRKELEQCLVKAEGLALNGKGDTLDLCGEICAGCVLLAEQNWRNQERTWEISSLAGHLLRYARHLEGYDHELDYVNSLTRRMIEVIPEGHPRLKLKMLQFRLLVLQRIEALADRDLSATEEVEEEIGFLKRNIDLADRGVLNEIEQEGHLKEDPVEWTLRFEEAVDSVEKELDLRLEGVPRGMGFCFAYWAEKKNILKEFYGIDWKTPSEMNPGVLFD